MLLCLCLRGTNNLSTAPYLELSVLTGPVGTNAALHLSDLALHESVGAA